MNSEKAISIQLLVFRDTQNEKCYSAINDRIFLLADLTNMGAEPVNDGSFFIDLLKQWLLQLAQLK